MTILIFACDDQEACPSCGADDDGTQTYCEECGERLADPTPGEEEDEA